MSFRSPCAIPSMACACGGAGSERPTRTVATTALAARVRPDGVQLVTTASRIVDSRILAPIDVDQIYVAGGITWTGSLGSNLPGDAATTCSNRGATAGGGDGGQIEYTFFWPNGYQSAITCLAAARVFCFQK